jgi:hypothetical protein
VQGCFAAVARVTKVARVTRPLRGSGKSDNKAAARQ